MDWRKVVVDAVDQDGTDIEIMVGDHTGSVVLWQDDVALWFTPEDAISLAKALTGYAAIAKASPGETP